MVSISAGLGGVEAEWHGGILLAPGVWRRGALPRASAACGTCDVVNGATALAIDETAAVEVAGKVSRLLCGDVAGSAAAAAVEGDVGL
jgi:hypothetical protein